MITRVEDSLLPRRVSGGSGLWGAIALSQHPHTASINSWVRSVGSRWRLRHSEIVGVGDSTSTFSDWRIVSLNMDSLG